VHEREGWPEGAQTTRRSCRAASRGSGLAPVDLCVPLQPLSSLPRSSPSADALPPSPSSLPLPTYSAQRIHSMIALGLSIDADEVSEPAAAEESGDVPPPLETAGASSMEEVD